MNMQLQTMAEAARITSSWSKPAGILQRKCSECHKKKRALQRFFHDFSQIQVQSRSLASIQAKLTVNTPGDIYEQEADRVADQVLADAGHPGIGVAPPHIQRFPVQPARQAEAAPASVDRVLASPGRPLEPVLRQEMEQRFGHDFSRVRVHTGAAAGQSAREVNANAYTVGHDVVFGTARFAPGTHQGRRLLAHELAHVVQQRGAGLNKMQRKHICENDPATAPAMDCEKATTSPMGAGLDVFFNIESHGLSAGDIGALHNFVRNWHASGGTDAVRVDGFASCDGSPDFNWRLSCDRALAVANELLHPSDTTLKGIDRSFVDIFADGETDRFSASLGPNRKTVVTLLTPTPPPPPPHPLKPVCPAVPSATPGSCAGRNAAYCIAAACVPSNPWLACVCKASGEVCRAVDAFTFNGVEGTALQACAFVSRAPEGPILDKGIWFLKTNRCIWQHWRAAFDAIHDPSRPVPGGLTPEWAAAVTICRTSGIGSKDCCEAHVRAEQTAIDHCSPYDSSRFGSLPSDVPGAPTCSRIVAAFTPPPPFTGDFGIVSDRISYGNGRCCP